MVATVPQSERDPAKVVFALRQIADVFNRQPPVMVGGYTKQIDLNSAASDSTIVITPPGTNYMIDRVTVKNVGTTASLTTATAGLFTASGAGGTALAALQTLASITANSVNSAHNAFNLILSSTSDMYMNVSSVYFRVNTAQGAAAVADVYVFIRPLP